MLTKIGLERLRATGNFVLAGVFGFGSEMGVGRRPTCQRLLALIFSCTSKRKAKRQSRSNKSTSKGRSGRGSQCSCPAAAYELMTSPPLATQEDKQACITHTRTHTPLVKDGTHSQRSSARLGVGKVGTQSGLETEGTVRFVEMRVRISSTNA